MADNTLPSLRWIGDDDGIHRVLHDCTITLFAFAQRLLGLPALGDVIEHPKDAAFPLQLDNGGGHIHHQLGSILTDQCHFHVARDFTFRDPFPDPLPVIRSRIKRKISRGFTEDLRPGPTE